MGRAEAIVVGGTIVDGAVVEAGVAAAVDGGAGDAGMVVAVGGDGRAGGAESVAGAGATELMRGAPFNPLFVLWPDTPVSDVAQRLSRALQQKPVLLCAGPGFDT